MGLLILAIATHDQEYQVLQTRSGCNRDTSDLERELTYMQRHASYLSWPFLLVLHRPQLECALSALRLP